MPVKVKAKKDRRPNPLRMDPTRTASLRRAFERQITLRFEKLRAKLRALLLDEDALGLDVEKRDTYFSHPVLGRNAFCPTGEGGGQDNSCSPSEGGSGAKINHKVVTEGSEEDADILLTQGIRPDFKRERVAGEFAPGAGLERGGAYVARDGAFSKGSFGKVRLHLSVKEDQLDVPQEMKSLGYEKGKEVAGQQSLDYVLGTENGGVTQGEVPASKFSKVEVYRDNKWVSMTPKEYLKERGLEKTPRLPSMSEYEKSLRDNADKWSLSERSIQQSLTEYNRANLQDKIYLAGDVGLIQNSLSVNCGGPGSGVPGPCPSVKAALKGFDDQMKTSREGVKAGTLHPKVAEGNVELAKDELRTIVGSRVETALLKVRRAMRQAGKGNDFKVVREAVETSLEEFNAALRVRVADVGGETSKEDRYWNRKEVLSKLKKVGENLAWARRRAGLTANERDDWIEQMTLNCRGVVSLTVNAGRWQFATDPQKVKEFKAWLRSQLREELTGRSEKELWEAYTRLGLQKGAGRAFDDTRRSQRVAAELSGKSDFYLGTRDEFLRSSFNKPVAIEKVQLLAERSFDELENVTSAMATRMTRDLTDGLVRGASPREIARDLDRDLDIGRNRSLTIARTECLLSNALIDAAVIRAVFRRWYVGDIVEVQTCDGYNLTATPNHPVLTQRGWVAFGFLQQGDRLIRRCFNKDFSIPRNPDIHRHPTTIGEIFNSLRTVGIVERRRTGSIDFHGDGTSGEVEVLSPDGELTICCDPSLSEPLLKQVFSMPDHTKISRLCFCRECSELLPVDQLVCFVCGAEGHASLDKSFDDTSTIEAVKHLGKFYSRRTSEVERGQLVGIDIPELVGCTALLPRRQLCLGVVSNLNSKPSKNFEEPLRVVPGLSGDFLRGDAGEIEIDEVLLVRVRKFAGHVYNLETKNGYYSTQGYYTGNCIRAHAEGQLMALEQLGVEEVGVAVEWSTAGDDHVCELCQPLEGVVLKLDEAKGMLPRHPNCRCAWIPANVGEDPKDQKDTQASIGRALETSIERDGGFEQSRWGGADLEPDEERPESQVGNEDYLRDFSKALSKIKGGS